MDRALAQRITDRVMETLGHNVNVMDAAGTIIGSGDPARLGETHEGALLAISRRRTVEVDEAAGRRLRGVRPGVNVPLVHRGEVVGAVGVTGDPEQLREVGRLLATTAELMVEQARVLDDAAWRRRRTEALVRALVADPADVPDRPAAAHAAAVRADELGIDLAVPRVALVLEPLEGEPATLLRDAQRALDAAPAAGGGPSALSALVESEQLLVLAADPRGADGALRDLGPLRARVRVGVGARFSDLPADLALPRSHRTALAALRAARRAGLPERRYADDPTTVLLADLPDDWRLTEVAAPWARLAEADRHGVLAATFAAYVVHGGDLAACGEALAVHRNTLRYRLDRLAALSGADARDPLGSTRLLLGAVRDPRWPTLVQPHEERAAPPV
nr:sugar diacid recognition domain-containing protein [Nocardioides perillae]